jgi:hypothetical protein
MHLEAQQEISCPVDPWLVLRSWPKDLESEVLIDSYIKWGEVARDLRSVRLVVDVETYRLLCESFLSLETCRTGWHREAASAVSTFFREHVRYEKFATSSICLGFDGQSLQRSIGCDEWLQLLIDSYVLNGRAGTYTAIASSSADGCLGATLSKLVGSGEDDSGTFPFSAPVSVCRDSFFHALNLVDPVLLRGIKFTGDVKFVYEDSGHQPTLRQKSAIERTATDSHIVIRAGTTYYNPNCGGVSSLSLTNNFSEIKFEVADGQILVKGVYKIGASNAAEANLAIGILDRIFKNNLKLLGLSVT